MIAYNVTGREMSMALSQVNERYENNICWNRFDRKEPPAHTSHTTITFTLKVVDSKKPGHALGVSHVMGLNWSQRRRLTSACWHVHGHFFEALFEINPSARIKSSWALELIIINEGNWEDCDRGSSLYPAMASECCDCGAPETLPKKVTRTRTFRRKIRS